MQLRMRTRDPEDLGLEEGEQEESQHHHATHHAVKKREDFFGIGNAIDTFSTTLLLRNKANSILEKNKAILEKANVRIDTKQIASDPIHNQRLQTILAGCLRAPDRLFQAKLADSTSCSYCGEEYADLKHVVCDCPKWQHARQPFQDALSDYIDQAGNQNPRRKEHMMQTLATPSVYHCGVIPEIEHFVMGGAPIPQRSTRQDAYNSNPDDIPPIIHNRLNRDETANVYAYIDGSACNPMMRGDVGRDGESTTP